VVTADFDSDGDSDGSDFLAWQRGLGRSGAPRSAGDANGDGVVGSGDLGVWKESFLGPVAAAAAVVMPGNFDGDGDVDGADLLTWQVGSVSAATLTQWKGNFGAHAVASAASMAAGSSATLTASQAAGAALVFDHSAFTQAVEASPSVAQRGSVNDLYVALATPARPVIAGPSVRAAVVDAAFTHATPRGADADGTRMGVTRRRGRALAADAAASVAQHDGELAVSAEQWDAALAAATVRPTRRLRWG
jgi:hypothetical protein